MVQVTPASAKTLLRAEMRARRRGLAAELPEAAATAAGMLPAEMLGRFAIVSGYRPQGAEIDPWPLLRRLRDAGAKIALPAVVSEPLPLDGGEVGEGVTSLRRTLFAERSPPSQPFPHQGGRALVFRRHDPSTPLEPDALGMLSPPASAEQLDPDLIIAPLVAFDLEGHRLGQGGGYYDRAIAALRARKPVFVLGLAYAGQQAARIPAEPHDQTLDAILTEKGYIQVRKDI